MICVKASYTTEKNLYLFCLVFPCLEINVQQSVKYDLVQRSLKFQSGSFKVPMSYLLFLRVDVFINIFKKTTVKVQWTVSSYAAAYGFGATFKFCPLLLILHLENAQKTELRTNVGFCKAGLNLDPNWWKSEFEETCVKCCHFSNSFWLEKFRC